MSAYKSGFEWKEIPFGPCGFQYIVESEVEKESENLRRAQAVFEEALEHAKVSLGPRAPVTVRAWSALAEALRRRGQVEEADRIVEEHVEPFPAESLDADLGPIPDDAETARSDGGPISH